VHGDECLALPGDDLGWGLGTIFRAYVAAATSAFRDLPGGPRGYQVLASAARGSVATQLALAQHLGVDRTVMTYLLDELESAALIERRPDPTDRRARRIVATPAGEALLTRLDDCLGAVENRLLGALDEDARRTFRAMIQKIATSDAVSSGGAVDAARRDPS